MFRKKNFGLCSMQWTLGFHVHKPWRPTKNLAHTCPPPNAGRKPHATTCAPTCGWLEPAWVSDKWLQPTTGHRCCLPASLHHCQGGPVGNVTLSVAGVGWWLSRSGLVSWPLPQRRKPSLHPPCHHKPPRPPCQCVQPCACVHVSAPAGHGWTLQGCSGGAEQNGREYGRECGVEGRGRT